MRSVRTIKAEMFEANAKADALRIELREAEEAAKARKIAKCEHNYVLRGHRYWEGDAVFDTTYEECTKCKDVKNRVVDTLSLPGPGNY